MRNPWNILRCKLGGHRWETIRVAMDKGKQCRHCHERIFATTGSGEMMRYVPGAPGAMGDGPSV